MKKKLAIQKQKHTLLQKQIEQQKVLFGKLESNKSMSVADKTTIIKVNYFEAVAGQTIFLIVFIKVKTIFEAVCRHNRHF